ncbi:fec operon regulator FecR [Pigmentiphaga humi]|uniref:Fec operon regulator FecR n=1 Tax=Pigmentiphaga humi TaxID=2478468 RepID=A0A3P4AX20_9BURK|nr:FecR domain-containing protein [Pigmentiphaga humi]VCU68604.1 fec operon regulator FecR [Pigmentiphaga humi]
MSPPPFIALADDRGAPIPADVRRQAACWLVELQSDDASEDLRQRWRRWRAAHPDHERAWQRIESFGGTLRGLPPPLAHATLASGNPARRQALKTMAMLLLAGGGAWFAEEHAPWGHWTADHRTGTGERARLTLPDGTHVELNSGTAVDVRYTATERMLVLRAGEILVATAHDPQPQSRPFLVRTAQGSARALGTRFTVRDPDAAGASRVAVFDGAVEIRSGRNSDAALVLRAGTQGSFTRDDVRADGAADENAMAWTQGMIVAQDMPLARFLEELGRHRPGRLACDPAVAGLKVSGTYPLADTDRVLDMLATTLPVQVLLRTRYWVTVQPDPRRI